MTKMGPLHKPFLSTFPVQGTMIVFVVVAMAMPVVYTIGITECPCTDKKLCDPVKTLPSKEPEVYVFSRGTTNVHLWMWNTINTLVVPPEFNKSDVFQASTMCFAHRLGKKFAISVEFNVTGQLKQESAAAEAWRTAVFNKQKAWFADIITIDFLAFFRNDETNRAEDYGFLAGLMHRFRQELPDVEIMCVMPWLPPCSKPDNGCDFAQQARYFCSYIVINPDSFLDSKGTSCVARANIPFSKLMYGISEYNTHHVPANRIVLGTSWHGYDYTCNTLVNNVCTTTGSGIPGVNVSGDGSDGTTCDYDKRKRISHADILVEHKTAYAQKQYSDIYDASFYNYKDGSVNHQVWFDGHDTFIHKYRLVRELGLKGIAVMYGDDLALTNSPHQLTNNGLMWSWLGHEMLLKKSKISEETPSHWANTVAGVAVGCLILGVVLGFTFACIGLQKRVKRPMEPFHRDRDPLGADYTDDPEL